MKKIVITTILVYLTSFSVKGQYLGPKSLVIGDVSANNYQVIYPLGWSEKGIFAYIHQDMNVLGAAEIYFYTVIFQNMKTNEIRWTLNIEYNLENYNHYHYSSDDTSYNYAFFKQIVWDSYGQEIEDKLKLYNIEREDSSLHKVDDLPKDISLKESETKNDSDSEISVRYNIKLFKPHKFKPVYDYDCTKIEDPCDVNETIWYRTFTVKGYFKSPFENRIAILVFKETNGFEEAYEYPFFAGTHLEKGFMDIGCKQ